MPVDGGGNGRVTIATVAARAGRSISTVSAALNGSDGVAASTREEIVRIAAELGYQADPRARSLRRRHTGLIGAGFAVGQAFQGLLVDGLYRAASLLDHSLVLAASTPHRDVAQGLRALLSERCEGVVLVDPGMDTAALALQLGRTPAVLICPRSELPEIDEVRSRDDVGVGALVDHLVASGRRRIVHLDGGVESAARQRIRAYCGAMAGHGLDRWVRVVPAGADEDSGARAVAGLLGRGAPPEALVCFNDHCAVGALMELRRQGIRVPQEVAVTGYDDIPVTASSAFSLTTVRQDAALLAEIAVRVLLSRIHPDRDPQVPPDVEIDERASGGRIYSALPELVVRGTTAPAR